MKSAMVWSLLLLAGFVACTPVENKISLPIEKPDWWPDWEKPDWWPDSIPPHPEWVPDHPDWVPDIDWGAIEWPDIDWGAIEWPDIDWGAIEWPEIDWDAIPRPDINRATPGTKASIEEYPGIVQIEIGTGVIWAQACAGSILTARHILTSARCFSGRLYDISRRRVLAGATSRSDDGVISGVASAVTHPSYGDTTENFFESDIGVVTLASLLTFDSTIQQSPIVAPDFNIPTGTSLRHVGYGSTAQGNKISDGELYSIDLVSVDNNACSELWNRLIPLKTIKVSSSNICAAIPETGGRDTDFRDIGAPIYINNIVVGIVSWGNPLGNQRFPLVATDVSSYTNWIVSNTL